MTVVIDAYGDEKRFEHESGALNASCPKLAMKPLSSKTGHRILSSHTIAQESQYCSQPNTVAMPEEKKPIAAPAAQSTEPTAEKAPAAKKEKPPAIEAKPFQDFIQEHYLPGLKAGFEQAGIGPVDLHWVKQVPQVVGYSSAPECWQIEGKWSAQGQNRQFNLYFYDEDIQGQRGFSATNTDRPASTLESFRIDEKKVTLDLLLLGLLQRLNGQKWLARN